MTYSAGHSTAPVVSVLMVSYRTKDLTLRALAGLRETCRVPYQVVVVDNASGDDTAAAVAAAHPDAVVESLPDNVGFGRAVNHAATRARGEWLLLINPDTEPVGDVVGALVDYATSHPEHGIYTGRTLHPDGSDDRRSCFALPSLRGYVAFATGLSTVGRRIPLLGSVLNPEELPRYDRSHTREVPAVSGCLLLIRRALFTRLEGFRPDYFMYSEDVDLCARASRLADQLGERLGGRPVLVAEARLRHLGGASSTSAHKRIMVLRGKCTYLRLNWPRRRAAAGRALIAVGVGMRAAVATILRRESTWRTAWRERATWLVGYPPVATTRSERNPTVAPSAP